MAVITARTSSVTMASEISECDTTAGVPRQSQPRHCLAARMLHAYSCRNAIRVPMKITSIECFPLAENAV